MNALKTKIQRRDDSFTVRTTKKRYCLLDDVLLFLKKERVPIFKLLFSASQKAHWRL